MKSILHLHISFLLYTSCLGKLNLKIAAESWLPYILVYEDDGKLRCGGPMGEVLDILSERMNFSYTIVKPPDGLWGLETSNGSWTGMIGMVHRKEVDMALGPFSVNSGRASVADFSITLVKDTEKIMYQRPKVSNDVMSVIKPFGKWVWLLVLCSGTLAAVIFWTVFRLESTLLNVKNRMTLGESIYWTVGTFAHESSPWLPTTDASRCVIAGWLFFALIVMKSYEVILTAMLGVPIIRIPIDSLEDLLGQDEIPFYLEAGSDLLGQLKQGKSEAFRRAYKKHSGLFRNCWDDRMLLINENIALVCDETTMKKSLHWDFRIDQVIKSGIFAKWINDQMPNATNCQGPPSIQPSISALNLTAYSGIFIILGFGYIMAVSALVGEKIYHKIRSQNISVCF